MGKQPVYSVFIALLIVSTMVVALFLGGIATTIAQNDGPAVSISTNYAVANQRITLSATGFTPNAEIGEVAEGETQVSGITISGQAIPWDRFNGGNTVSIDSDGEWSAALNLPLTALTTAAGSKTLEATDSAGVSDTESFNIGARSIGIDPHGSRVGTLALISGEGFPSKNDSGSSFTITVTYDNGSGNVISIPVQHWDSGQLEAQFRIPATWAIPSTNTVKASFQDDNGVVVEETITHQVLPPIIYLNPTSGVPRTGIRITGEGFRDNVPISHVSVGTILMGAPPNSLTDSNGMLSLDTFVPNLAPAIVTVKVTAGNLTATAEFTITPGPPLTPTPRPTWTPTPPPANTPTPTPTTPQSVLDGTIRLSPASGLPGSIVTVHGVGFPPSRALRGVQVGSFNAMPNPVPSADQNGRLTFDFVIPSLDPGTYNVFVKSGHLNVAHHQLRVLGPPTPTPAPTPTPTASPLVTPAPQLPGGQVPPHVFIGTASLHGNAVPEGTRIKAYAGNTLVGSTTATPGGKFSIHTHRSSEAITFTVADKPAGETWANWESGRVTPGFNLNASSVTRLEDSPWLVFQANPELVSVFTYDNTRKQWQFFDPTVGDASTIEKFTAGQVYLFRVSRTATLRLNGVSRTLSCVNGNCWNQVVW